MSQKVLRKLLIYGTIFFALVLTGLTVNSLTQVAGQRTAEVTDQVVSGKKMWQFRNCNDCHTILGIGAYWAPDLTKEADRRGAQFLIDWLKDPQAVKPGTTMPNQHLTDTEVQDLVTFLQWVDKIDTNNWPPQPVGQAGGAPGASVGAVLFQELFCMECHMINGQGTSWPGPDLSHIGSQPYDGLSNTPDFLYKWIENPAAQKPTTIMPAITMTDGQRHVIVDYLTSLK